ncbi:MAG TPA: hypothetical protein ENI56_02165 [Candidatus Kaiserbacteria bacterium]|nr:hypothetical protein [Candidatus Kaiserbacteria bacterium]
MTFFTKTSSTPTDQQQGEFIISQPILKSLAIVGFSALVIAGIALAIYMARFAPFVIGTFESGTAYMSAILTPQPSQSNLTVVPQTTLPFGKKTGGNTGEVIGQLATSTKQKTSHTTGKKTASKKISQVHRNAQWHTTGKKTTYQIYPHGKQGATTVPKYYGLPDLATTITAVGYLTSSSTNSFVVSNTIPAHAQVAVKFRITNQGTNVTGPWNLEIHIPTELNSIYQSKTIKSLVPGQPEDFMVHFTNAIAGTNEKIIVVADPKNQVKESNEKNNSASVGITILKN